MHVCLLSGLAVLGGNPKNFSARAYEPVHQHAKRTTHNGKDTHLQFTDRSNLQQDLSHMALGHEWEALVLDKHKQIVDIRVVRGGDGLLDLLRSVPAHRELTPYETSSPRWLSVV